MTDNNQNNENHENSSENSKADEMRAGAFERFTNRKKRFRENAQKKTQSIQTMKRLSHHKKSIALTKNQTTTTNKNMPKHEITPKKNWIATK